MKSRLTRGRARNLFAAFSISCYESLNSGGRRREKERIRGRGESSLIIVRNLDCTENCDHLLPVVMSRRLR